MNVQTILSAGPEREHRVLTLSPAGVCRQHGRLGTTGGDHTTCPVLLQDIFRRRPFNIALRRSRMARFVEVNMGITPRNVRSEGVAPCK
jgi:hypothetical protein